MLKTKAAWRAARELERGCACWGLGWAVWSGPTPLLPLCAEGVRKIRGLAFEAGSSKAHSQGMDKQRGHRYF